MTLNYDNITLKIINKNDLEDLTNIALDQKLWEFGLNRIQTKEEMLHYFEEAAKSMRKGTAFVWVIRKDSKIIGTTRIANIDQINKSAQLGWTWINPLFHNTAVNKISKMLVLKFAFDYLKLNRIEFRTDKENQRSNFALKAIGAKFERTLKSHVITWKGNRRDTNIYSILEHEWNVIEKNLLKKILQ